MAAKLYSFSISHPGQAVERMLDLKGIPYATARVLPGNQRIHLRLAGFRDGTVPAIKIGGRKVQGSRPIARVIDELVADPPLFPDDGEARRRADEAERWGDEELQDVPRRIMRWGLKRNLFLREWLARESSMPGPAIAARITGLNARYYARLVAADEQHARADVESIPALLDRVGALIDDGTLPVEQPIAASFQVLCSIRSLDGLEDFHDVVAAHPAGVAARKLFPQGFTSALAPAFVPGEWLSPR
jgi:glutathione S-transferase